MASVPVTVLLYDGLSLCGFNVVIKGLKSIGKVFCIIYQKFLSIVLTNRSINIR